MLVRQWSNYNVIAAVFSVPLFDCTFYHGRLTEMRNDSKQHREAFGEILNQAAWDYKYHHSWVTKGDTQAKAHSESESLHFCIHNNLVKGFKAYKVLTGLVMVKVKGKGTVSR